jgi:hypothetical protein
MNELLERIVPPFDEAADWEDVLRRARVRRAPRRLVLAVAVVGAVLVVGPALGVLLTRDATPRLPSEADKRNVVVILQPLTGRVLMQVAPWKGHDGICYVLLFKRAGCVLRTPHGAVVVTPPIAGYTFDDRVVSGTAVTLDGKRVPLQVERFPRLKATFFFRRGRLPGLFKEATLRDSQGRVVARYALKH